MVCLIWKVVLFELIRYVMQYVFFVKYGFILVDFVFQFCFYVLYFCKKVGVKFIFDQKNGVFDKFIYEGKIILGVVIKDGKEY